MDINKIFTIDKKAQFKIISIFTILFLLFSVIILAENYSKEDKSTYKNGLSLEKNKIFDKEKNEVLIKEKGMLESNNIAKITLIKNTDECLIDCESIFNITLYDDYKDPLTNTYFLDKDKEEKKSVLDYKWFYLVNKSYEVEISDYKTSCTNVSKIMNKTLENKTIEECFNNIIGTHNETRYRDEWKEYKNDNLKAGNYVFKIQAKKPASIEVDMIPELFGISLDEYVWWNSSWDKKKLINITSSVGNFSYLIINYDSDMQSDFDDLRFINYAENLEYNYTIENKVDSNYSSIRVFSQGEDLFYVYYGNNAVSTTSNYSKVYFNPISYWYFDETSGTNLVDSIGVNNGTNNGATINQVGKINASYDFDGVNDKVLITGTPFEFGDNDFSISLWVKTPHSESYKVFIAKDRNNGESIIVPYLIQKNKNNKVQFAWYNSDWFSVTSSGYIGNNEWTHLVATYQASSNTPTIYVDNVKTSGSSQGDPPPSLSGDLKFMRSEREGNWANGLLDEVGIWNRMLSDDEIYNLYTSSTPEYTIGDEIIYSPTNLWNCTTGTQRFDNVSCWSLNRVPVDGDEVLFNGTANANCNITNNTLAQNLLSFKVDSNYRGTIYFNPLFAVGNWTGENTGTQLWNVTNNIDILNSTMKIYGDYPYNITEDGHGQEWRSLNGNITIGTTAILDGIGLGFPAYIGPGSNLGGTYLYGGTYGGLGGGGPSPPLPYGNATSPTSLGSGGTSTAGGSGIKLEGTNFVLVNGQIKINGINGGRTGSGGSIWLKANNISGSGSLQSDGGSTSIGYGAGSGGRIRLEYENTLDYTGNISLASITTGNQSGTHGSLTFTNNTWAGDWDLTGNIGLLGGDYGEGNVTNVLGNFNTNGYSMTIYGDCFYSATNPVTCYNKTTDGRGVWINASGNINISSGTTLNGNLFGFTNDFGPGSNGGTNYYGGTYGGKGYANTKAVYGDEYAPVSLGSGGDNGKSGSAIKLEALGNVSVDGTLTFIGGGGYGGGSGGSIWIDSDSNILGSGILHSYGVSAGTSATGGGGGGRVALTGNSVLFNGLINNNGGITIGGESRSGYGGSVYINSSSVVSSMNISTYGYSGGNVSLSYNYFVLSGIYNATGLVSNGTITINYTNCSSDFNSAIFYPSAIYNSACNILPSVTTPVISPSLPGEEDNLNCSFKVDDLDVGDSLSANVSWYKNNVKMYSTVMTVFNNVANYSILNSGNTTSGENWTCEVYPFDGTDYGTGKNSSLVYIHEVIPPQIEFVSPTPNNATSTGNTSVIINTSITESNLANVVYNWNGTNTSFYDDSLVLMMNFDNRSSLGENSTRVVDLSKYGNNGTVSEATWNSEGKYGGAYQFDGVDDYINSGSDSSLDNLPAITLSAWIYPITEGEGGLGYILEKSGSDTSGFRFRTQNIGGSQPREIAFRVDYSTTDMYRYSNNNMINLNEWNYVVVTWDGSSSYSNIHIYVNGEEVTYRLNSDGVGTRVSDSSNSLIIGNNLDNSSTFNGSIDEVRIYNRSLSALEVKQLYNSNLAKYSNSEWNLYVNQSNLSNGVYTYQSFASDVAGNFNSTDLRYLTINSDTIAPNISNLNWITDGGFTSSSLFYNQILEHVNVTATSEDAMNVSLTITNPDGNDVIKDQLMTNYTASDYSYNANIVLNRAGIWILNATANDSFGNINYTTRNITVFIQSQSLKDGWYGYSGKSILSSAEINSLSIYGYDIFELEENMTNLQSNFQNILDSINNSREVNIKSGLNIILNFDYNNTALQTQYLTDITENLSSLKNIPYFDSVQYISLEVVNTGSFLDTTIYEMLNTFAENITSVTENSFIIFSKNYNSSNLDSSYISYTDLIYLNSTNEANFIEDQKRLFKNNVSLNRIYVNIPNNVKAIAQNFHSTIIDSLRSIPNPGSLTNLDVSSLNNKDVIIFNNGSSSQNFTIDVSALSVAGKDVWDSTEGKYIEANTDETIVVEVKGYNATIVYFEDLDHIQLNSLEEGTLYKGSYQSIKNSNRTDGTLDGNFGMAGAYDIQIELFDQNYVQANFITYYGWLNVSRIKSPKGWENYDVVILADKNNAELDALNYSVTEFYGYISVGDYVNTQEWTDSKITEVDSWLSLNDSLDIFIDGMDSGVGGVNFSSRVKDLIDYVQIAKNKKAMLNTYTAYEDFATWGKGGIMKESCVNRWNGLSASDPTNYTREDWSLELTRSEWFTSHNVDVYCQSFGNRTIDGSNTITDYDDLQNIYFASKVLGYDYFYLSQPDFGYAHEEWVYDVGNNLDRSAHQLSTDINTYYRAYENGIVYYNTTSGEGWIDDGLVVNSMQTCFYLYNPYIADATWSFNINNRSSDGSIGEYSFNQDWAVGTWTWKCLDTTGESPINGRYLIEAWVGAHTTIAGQGFNLGWSSATNTGQNSWYDVDTTDNFVAYPQDQNWMINISTNTSKKISIDTTDKITQTEVDGANYRNLTITSEGSFPIEVWSKPTVFDRFGNVSFLNSTGSWINLNYENNSDCDSGNPIWGTTNIEGNIYKACIENADGGTLVRVTTPSLSIKQYQITQSDTAPPYFTTIPENASISYGTYWNGVQFEATDEIEFDTFLINDTTNFIINSTGFLNWTGQLVVGDYYLNVSINDTFGNGNYTIYNLNITKNENACDVLFNETSPLNYTSTFQVYSNCDSSFTLYRNGTEVANNSEHYLGAGIYNFTVIRTDTENYSNTYDEELFTIDKSTSIVYTYLNNVRGNATINKYSSIWLNGTLEQGYGDIYLYINESLNKIGESPLSSYYNFTELGLFNITTIYPGNENYTSSFETFWVNVADTTAPKLTIIYPNNTIYNKAKQLVNISAEDTSLDKIWYNWNGTNITYTVPINITFNEGANILVAYANDSYGNINSTNISFSIDTYFQNISIISPIEGYNIPNYVSGSVPVSVNFSVNDTNLQSCKYEVTGAQSILNTSITCSNGYNNFSFSPSTSGSFIILVYSNDSAGNEESDNVTMTITAYSGPSSGGGSSNDPTEKEENDLNKYNSTIICNHVSKFLKTHQSYTYEEKESLKNLIAIELGFAISNEILNKYLTEFDNRCPEYYEDINVTKTEIDTIDKEEVNYSLIIILSLIIITIIIILIVIYDNEKVNILFYSSIKNLGRRDKK